ncbi:Stk1 family PASTA domain-containing Ser/Thr kinase [Clostridium akagii]|uniref:Stk1 family PASTA domain-containing Ser/Thr kinase n=1 Tax=Clostridium akagii TaxID=91623 RepID=UPI00068A9D01|nr:Stk1 family PASTA domain-containing Ser/Thr kinase [Clostridium akagii]
MIGTLLLNRYELLEKIGEGGMGDVYKAKCHLLNRFVAVKILKSEFSMDENFVARFKREASAVASVSHPNIVNVYDVGEENSINFIVMEYISGKTLKQVIKENVKLNAYKTIDISLQVAKALQCAHKNNIIHRDIKPDNIMITEDNIVKVMDFGIAKVSESHTMTNSKTIMGSVYYFSPEQAKGFVVDCRTDIYSLGIVMYEMVTGKVPFDAESPISIAMMHIKQSIVEPKEIITDLPKTINQVILKAVEKENNNRYQSADEMIQAISTIKEEFDFSRKLNNRPNGATKLMDTVVSDTKQDCTRVMSKNTFKDNLAVKKNKKILPENKATSKNKKKIIIIVTILLVMITIGVIGKYISKSFPTSKTNTVTKAGLTKEIKKTPLDSKKLVPSLIGITKDIAEKTITNNGFLIGNITSQYSDSIPKGSVIGQSPDANTSYAKGVNVDLVISQGQKVVPVTIPKLKDKIHKDIENHVKGPEKFR